jgi:hypothetical protein
MITDTQLRALAEKAKEARDRFENRRPGGFKSAFNYEDYRKADRLYRKAANPEAILALLDMVKEANERAEKVRDDTLQEAKQRLQPVFMLTRTHFTDAEIHWMAAARAIDALNPTPAKGET